MCPIRGRVPYRQIVGTTTRECQEGTTIWGAFVVNQITQNNLISFVTTNINSAKLSKTSYNNSLNKVGLYMIILAWILESSVSCDSNIPLQYPTKTTWGINYYIDIYTITN